MLQLINKKLKKKKKKKFTANLEGRGSSGKFEPHFHGENGSEREKTGDSYLCVTNYSKLQKPYRPLLRPF